MPVQIIILSDGTGNSDAALWRTNVWRLLHAIDRSATDQFVYYDKGVGTSGLFGKLLGLALGMGLPRNVLALYKFVCQTYSPGARIYAFGFSRGAYTIRVVTELLLSEGVVPNELSDIEMDRRIRAAYRAYRARTFRSVFGLERLFRGLRNSLLAIRYGRYDRANNSPVEQIAFLGLWDTVGAYGLPLEAVADSISRLIWPFRMHTGKDVPRVARVRHALSLDDDRRSFFPILWPESDEDAVYSDSSFRSTSNERVSQVWFPGEHSNLGGGNPDDSLALISLDWMLTEASKAGLRLSPFVLEQVKGGLDVDGGIYKSRQGLGSLYRYAPRRVSDFYPPGRIPKMHESVFKRMHGRYGRYSPIGVPARYEVVEMSDRIVHQNSYEPLSDARARIDAEERVWNMVWIRRLLYLTTVGSIAQLLAFPIIDFARDYRTNGWSKPLSNLIQFFGSYIPGFLNPWVQAYARSPIWLLFVLVLLAASHSWGQHLEARIQDEMRRIWRVRYQPAGHVVDRALQFFRTLSKPFNLIFEKGVIPLGTMLVAFLVFLICIGLANRVAFDFSDAVGMVCHSRSRPTPARREETLIFRAQEPCQPTGILLQGHVPYSIEVTLLDPWYDGRSYLGGTIDFTAPDESAYTWSPIRFLAVLFRRNYSLPFFSLIGRFGTGGSDVFLLDPRKSETRTITIPIVPSQSAELFLYVNDAVLFPASVQDLFYRNNKGTAEIRIRRDERADRPPS